MNFVAAATEVEAGKWRDIREIRDLTQQDGWKTQDGRMTKKYRVRLGILSLARHFFVILPS